MGEIITHFEIDEEKLTILQPCMENYGVGSDRDEWSHNIISNQAVIYQNGVIARRNSVVNHSVDPVELALCKTIANEAESMMAGVEVGMGSESSDIFRQFFIAANTNEVIPNKIDESLIRAKFGSTIFPLAAITIEPLSESGIWWSEVEYDGSESPPEYFKPWKEMIAWFNSQPELIDTAFVRIGDSNELLKLSLETNMFPGCVLPRLILGLTEMELGWSFRAYCANIDAASHPIGGSQRVFSHFSGLELVPPKWRCPAHQRVNQIIS